MKKIYYLLIFGCILHSTVKGMEKNNSEKLSGWSLVSSLWSDPSPGNTQTLNAKKGFIENIGSGLADSVSDTIQKKMETCSEQIKGEMRAESNRFILKVFAGTALAITLYFASKLVWNRIERYLNKPKLDFKVTHNEFNGKAQKSDPLECVLLSQKATEQLKNVVEKTARAKKNILEGDSSCSYRGLLLYGPKGSGKRLFAQNFAQSLGMDFIDLSVASLTKYKEEADIKEAFDGLFQGTTANSSQGSVVFIDNARILFPDRKLNDNAPLSRAISALIEHVEQGSNRFILVLSVHTEEELPLAAEMASIIHNSVYFERPDLAARVKLLTYYRDLLLAHPTIPGENVQLTKLVLTDEKVQKMAENLDGASAKDVFDVIDSIKMDALSPDKPVSESSIEMVMQDIVERIKKNRKPNGKIVSPVLTLAASA